MYRFHFCYLYKFIVPTQGQCCQESTSPESTSARMYATCIVSPWQVFIVDSAASTACSPSNRRTTREITGTCGATPILQGYPRGLSSRIAHQECLPGLSLRVIRQPSHGNPDKPSPEPSRTPHLYQHCSAAVCGESSSASPAKKGRPPSPRPALCPSQHSWPS